MTIAVLHEYMPNVGSAKTLTHDELARYFERVQALEASSSSEATDSNSEVKSLNLHRNTLVQLAKVDAPPLAQETIGGYLDLAELLGRRVGEFHVASANAQAANRIRARAVFSRLYQRGLYQSMRNQSRTTLEMLRARRYQISESDQARAEQVLQQDQCNRRQVQRADRQSVFKQTGSAAMATCILVRSCSQAKTSYHRFRRRFRVGL